MARSDARFGYRADLSRDLHHLSQPFGFSCAPGMLCPIFADIASPGDTYYINHDLSFLRTGPLASPAMIDVKVHYETFFVPMQMIYQPFENTFFSLKPIQSSNFNSANFLNEKFPLFDYRYYYSQLCHDYPIDTLRTKAFRLADFLDLQAGNFCQTDVTTFVDSDNYYLLDDHLPLKYHPSFFPWQILTYNTIFQYYFRLDDKQDFNPYGSNWDRYYDQSVPVKIVSNSDFMTIHQRPWDFDYFMSMYRSPIVSDANLQSILPNRVYQPLVNKSTQPIDSQGNFNSATPPHMPNSDMVAFSAHAPNTYSSTGENLLVSTASIRQMFANEKLAMITGRTRKNYDSQVLAHLGVSVPKDIKHDLQLIGRDTYQLRVTEVTSLASTAKSDGSPLSSLGDLAGKGYASGKGHDIKFTCPTHGVIMTIFSIEPMKRYFSGFGRQNAVTSALDLPVSEYDRLGNQPMYHYETGFLNVLGQNWVDVIGWNERYYQWKRRKPRVTLGFMELISSPSDPKFNDWEPYFLSEYAFGAKGSSNAVRPDLQNRFYIDPQCLDHMMLVNFAYSWHDGSSAFNYEDWNDNPNLVYCRDPFIVDSDLKVNKVSWMSKDGEPIYNY